MFDRTKKLEVVDNNSSADLLNLNKTLFLEEYKERKLLLKINSFFWSLTRIHGNVFGFDRIELTGTNRTELTEQD